MFVEYSLSVGRGWCGNQLRRDVMAVILYVAPGNGWETNISKFFQNVSPETDYMVCNTLEDLSSTMCRRFFEISVVMLVSYDREDFARIFGMKELLEDKYLLLTLPDQEEDTIAKALKMRPRFIAQTDGGMDEVNKVLKSMIERYDNFDFRNKNPAVR
jgi:hypothetical protein